MATRPAQLERYRGGVVHEIDEWETRRLRERYADSHKSFHRPPTRLNLVADRVVNRVFRRRRFTADEANAWLVSSLGAFAEFVDDPAALEEVRQGTIWFVCDATPPDRDVWSGECQLDDDRSHPPITFLYTRSIACRMPSILFEVGWLGALDHFVGHLYPYFKGRSDPIEYDETVACRNQHLAAQVRGRRDWRFRVAAHALPVVYRFHKDIELGSYRSVDP
jgi:hypothetical protein